MATYIVPIRETYNGAGGPGYNDWCVVTPAATAGGSDTGLASALTALKTFYTAISNTSSPFPLSTKFFFDGTVSDAFTKGSHIGGTAWEVDNQGVTSNFANVLQLGVKLDTGTYAGPTGGKLRRQLGRKFLGPLNSQTLDTDGTPVNSYVTSVQTALNSLISGGTASTWQIAVFSRKHNSAISVQKGTVEDRFSVLRSRRNRLTTTS